MLYFIIGLIVLMIFYSVIASVNQTLAATLVFACIAALGVALFDTNIAWFIAKGAFFIGIIVIAYVFFLNIKNDI